MNAFAGAMLPAAVVSIGRNFGIIDAPIRTALYPATVLCDDSTSIDCALVMRGTRSRLSAVTDRSARAGRMYPALAGENKLTSTVPVLSARASAADGGCTFVTTSLSASASVSDLTTVAPAAV